MNDLDEGGLSTLRDLDAPASRVQVSKYRLIAELGSGGMANIFLAMTAGPGGFSKLHVIKNLRSNLAHEPEFLDMFMEEARLAARINHPNVVQTNEVGFDGQHHFIAMEYLEGQSLETIVREVEKNGRREDFPLHMHLRVIAEVLAGLHFAHELTDFDGTPLNVVHRDVSPHNVMVTYDGHVKLLDFGIAKASDSNSNTSTGVLKGKAAYMSREQFGGKNIDRRTDVFAVGVMMWQALTGRRLWKGLSDGEILERLIKDEIPKPTTVDPEIPPQLETICLRALQVVAALRYSTAAEMQADIEAFLDALPSRASARDVGKQVTELFASQRANIRSKIDERVKEARLAKSDSFQVTALTATTAVPAVTGEALSITAPAPRPRNQALVAVFAGLGLLMVVILGVLIFRPRAVADSAKKNLQARVTINALPKMSSIYVDDRLLDSNPAVLQLPRDGARHQVRVEATGYVANRDVVVADSASVSIDVVLEEVTSVSQTTAASASAKPSGVAASRPAAWQPAHHPVASTAAATPAVVAPPVTTPAAPVAPPTVNPDAPRVRKKKQLDATNPFGNSTGAP